MKEAFFLKNFGTDLCDQARAGALDPVAVRPGLVESILLVLARRTKRCPVLVGEPGVGKSALVEGLAQSFVSEAIPAVLRGFTIFSLDLGSLLAGTSYRGDFEERLRALVSSLRDPASRRILFVDEIHLLDRAGRSEGGLDAANLLKPLLARGSLPCIGATTGAEWSALVERDPALERRFQVVQVPEPSPREALEMLRALRPRLEQHHGVRISDAALATAMDAAPRPGAARRVLPDRAIDRLDEACARVVLRGARLRVKGPPASLEIEAAVGRFDFEELARLRREHRQFDSAAPPPLPVDTADLVD